MSGLLRVCFVCTGNICRSPMGEIVLSSRLADAGLSEVAVVDSAGTGSWHVGENMDPRTARALKKGGYGTSKHRARRFLPDWFSQKDLILGMDRSHVSDLVTMANGVNHNAEIRLLGSYEGASEPDVPDPYYGSGDDFDSALLLVELLCDKLLESLRPALEGNKEGQSILEETAPKREP